MATKPCFLSRTHQVLRSSMPEAPFLFVASCGHALQLAKARLVTSLADRCRTDPSAPRSGDAHGLVLDGPFRSFVHRQLACVVWRWVAGLQDHGEGVCSVFEFEDDHGLDDLGAGVGWHGAALLERNRGSSYRKYRKPRYLYNRTVVFAVTIPTGQVRFSLLLLSRASAYRQYVTNRTISVKKLTGIINSSELKQKHHSKVLLPKNRSLYVINVREQYQ